MIAAFCQYYSPGCRTGAIFLLDANVGKMDSNWMEKDPSAREKSRLRHLQAFHWLPAHEASIYAATCAASELPQGRVPFNALLLCECEPSTVSVLGSEG